MAPAIVHFLLGAALFLLVAVPFAYRYEMGQRWALWLVVIGGVWGLFPDVHHITPVYETELRALHHSAWADLFAFHYTLDRPAVRSRSIESIFASVLLFLSAVTTFVLADVAGRRRRTAASGDRRSVVIGRVLGVSALLLGGVLVVLVGAVLGGIRAGIVG